MSAQLPFCTITPAEEHPLRILFIEDNFADTLLIKRVLRETIGNEHFDIIHTASIIDALAAVTSHTFDIVILDLNLLGNGGLQPIQELHSKIPDTPIVSFSGSHEKTAHQGLLLSDASRYMSEGHASPRALQLAIQQALGEED